MADNLVEILLRFNLDKSQATTAAAEIRKLKTETAAASQAAVTGATAAGAATKDYTGKIELASKAKKMLLGQLGQFGNLVRFAFSPASLAAAALAITIGKLKKSFDDWQQQLSDMEQSNAEALSPTKEKLEEIRLKTIEANEEFQKYQKTVSEKSSEMEADIKAQFEALEKVLKAEEVLALARSPDKEKTQAEFEALRGSLGVEQKRAILLEKQRQLAEVVTRGGDAFGRMQANLGGTTPERARFALKTLPDSIAAADRHLKNLETQLANMPKAGQLRNKEHLTPLDRILGRYSEPMPASEIAEMEAKIEATRRYKSGLENERARYTSGLTAFDEMEALGTQGRRMSGAISRGALDVSAERVSVLRSTVQASGQRLNALQEQAARGYLEAAVAAPEIGKEMLFFAQAIVELRRELADLRRQVNQPKF